MCCVGVCVSLCISTCAFVIEYGSVCMRVFLCVCTRRTRAHFEGHKFLHLSAKTTTTTAASSQHNTRQQQQPTITTADNNNWLTTLFTTSAQYQCKLKSPLPGSLLSLCVYVCVCVHSFAVIIKALLCSPLYPTVSLFGNYALLPALAAVLLWRLVNEFSL